MMVDPDPKRQRCEGILGATGTAGAEAGAKVTSMVNQLTSLLLSKSVVGETHEIDTNNIKVLEFYRFIINNIILDVIFGFLRNKSYINKFMAT